DDSQVELRKGLFEGDLALPPGAVGGQKLVNVGVNRKMRGGVPDRSNRKEHRAGGDPPGIVKAKADGANNEGGDRFHGWNSNSVVGPFEALRQRRNGGTGATMGYAFEVGAHGGSRCNGVRLVHEMSPARTRRRALDALKPLKSEIGIFS